jgi:hypothetical protein
MAPLSTMPPRPGRPPQISPSRCMDGEAFTDIHLPWKCLQPARWSNFQGSQQPPLSAKHGLKIHQRCYINSIIIVPLPSNGLWAAHLDLRVTFFLKHRVTLPRAMAFWRGPGGAPTRLRSFAGSGNLLVWNDKSETGHQLSYTAGQPDLPASPIDRGLMDFILSPEDIAKGLRALRAQFNNDQVGVGS